jgi:outer membrane protein TolC
VSVYASPLRRARFGARLGSLVALLSLAAAVPAVAQPVRVPSSEWLPAPATIAPPPAAGAPLALGDAVRLAVQYNPEVQRARQALARAVGRAQEARGVFDSVIEVDPGMRYLQNQVFPFIARNEDDKRKQVKAVFLAFDELNRELLAQLQQLGPRAPSCPIGFTVPGLEDDPFILDRLDPAETGIRAIERDLQSPSGAALEASLGIVRLQEICNPSPIIHTVQPELFLDFWRTINGIAQLNLNNIIDTFSQFPRENVLHVFEISEAVSTRALLALERLGGVPQDEVRKNPFIEASWAKLFRSGLSMRGEFRYESEERNFKDKSLDPSFGGFPVNPRFPSLVSLTTNLPLLKGRGAVSTAAPERAARLAIEAQREQLRHTIATEAFRTVLAFLSLQANQQTLRFLEESSARQRALVELTDKRFQTGDVIRLDVDRARARAARVESSVNSARGSLVAAQYALAQAIGLDVERFGTAPTAADMRTPSAADTLEPEAAIDAALAARHDLRSAERLRQASQALADGAAADLRNRLDLSATIGLSTLYESPFYKFLPDELEPLLLEPRIGFQVDDIKSLDPRQSPERYYGWDGFVRSVRAEWQPFAQVSLSLQLPFGNNQAKGRFGQAQASLRQSQIREFDVGRRIRDNIVSARGVVRRAAQALARIEEALKFQQTSHEGTLERYRQGDVTLLDTLTTEEVLTQSQIQLAQSWLGYAGALTRLRFEQGALVVFDDIDRPAESLRFDPAGLVAR